MERKVTGLNSVQAIIKSQRTTNVQYKFSKCSYIIRYADMSRVATNLEYTVICLNMENSGKFCATSE